MKTTLKLVAVLAFVGMGTSAQAQSNMPLKTKPRNTSLRANSMRDGVMMKDGKTVLLQGGQTLPMTQAVTMANGTKVLPNGTVTLKDGKEIMLQEGDMLLLDGKMMPIGRMQAGRAQEKM